MCPCALQNAPTIVTKCVSRDHSLSFSSQAEVLCAESNLPTYGISGKVGSTDVPRGEPSTPFRDCSHPGQSAAEKYQIWLSLQQQCHRAQAWLVPIRG